MVCILGSTGSIGRQALDVISRNPERFQVFALAAGSNVELLAKQCREFCPRYAALGKREAAAMVSSATFPKGSSLHFGEEAVAEMAVHQQIDIVIAAMEGSAGLLPTMAAVAAGKRVLLANKEALILAGKLLLSAARKSGAELVPVDSEHNAIFQCLGQSVFSESIPKQLSGVVLTASGGPFYKTPLHLLRNVTPQQACAHPRWRMGKKISVDSATMMNKGLEIIEAHLLFSLPGDRIKVFIHPQSIVHAMVMFRDGSVLAHLGPTDMRVAISHALAWPDRIVSGVSEIDLFAIGELNFSLPDNARYPCLKLAREALEGGHSAAISLSEANEVVTRHFLDGNIPFTGIAITVAEYMQRYAAASEPDCLDDVIALKRQVRSNCESLLRSGTLKF